MHCAGIQGSFDAGGAAATKLTGMLSASLTPFDANGVDVAAIREITEYHVAQGIDGFFLCGWTGEGALVSDPERRLGSRPSRFLREIYSAVSVKGERETRAGVLAADPAQAPRRS
jgi:hypothetical protein